MFGILGLQSRPAFLPYASGNETSRQFDAAAEGNHSHSHAQHSSSSGCCGSAAKAQLKAGGGCCN